MEKILDIMFEKATNQIEKCSSLEELAEIKVKFLGRKGEVTEVLKKMGSLPVELKPIIGKKANIVRNKIENHIKEIEKMLEEKMLLKKLENEDIDVTIPGVKKEVGHQHPISKMIDELNQIFIGMGFMIAEGPEIETVYNNFDALNSPENHPSRSKSDTFYINDELLLRTQTSPVQIRTMKSQEPPIKIISPGRCFRFDELDATHSPMFHQIEGLVIDENITMADLKGTLDLVAKRVFGENTMTKFRPHDFPFTEPSAEVDVTCFKCGGKGCKFCSGNGWIEILGCGMVHPKVLEECGIDSEKYSGFAFGMGIDRIAMLKYEIDDIRVLFENDVRFLKQF
ncbi:phenylalanine--tRNA ligase subunit alpha [Clostridiaceae bacterium HSG29]|nr:phenylalanine--tRNA ligase subunit alpha [Clostridiaceae bacterium HSG29]